MLRASNLQSLKQSPTLLSSLRFSVISSSLNLSSVVNPPKFFSSSSRLISFVRPFSSISSPYPSRAIGCSSVMSGYWSRKGRASFSAESSGNGGGGGDREILVQHLLVKEGDLDLLVELQKTIAKGVDLSDLAIEFSICPSKEKGGVLGWVRKGQMVPEFEEAAFNAPLNTIVRCKTKFGWHLLEVLSEREESLLYNIESEELHLKLQDPSFIEEVQLIDVREPEEVAQASLPGFQVLPLRQFGNWAPEITSKFDTEKDTYVLCHHGVRSLQVSKWLQTQGFRRVYNVSGGIHAYSVKADTSIPTY
ncbi:hypothetical protein Syun_001855 [Stephania yunnanensis]|uniref:Peptidyl-prolyl cis-trans isomerase n=1 Tax=Stephania yunnanensis TaxID=152371 RepID=A0AAP0LFJ4_9MAGN